MSEVERLQTIYHTYQVSPAVQARWSGLNPGNQAIVQERIRQLQKLLQGAGLLPLTRYTILDVGCGTGQVLASLIPWGARPEQLHGIDLLPERIELAQRQFPLLHFQQANAEQLEFGEACIDLVLLFTVFSSILDERMAGQVAREIERVLKPGGAVVWYDFRYHNPGNAHVRGMSKKSIYRLFPNFTVSLQPITLLPPLARRLGVATSLLYPTLSLIPGLRTHYLGLLFKPQEALCEI